MRAGRYSSSEQSRKGPWQCRSTVRSALLDFQRSFCESPPAGFRGAVLDGRDIGTVIYPGAPVKLFVTADPAIRAVRRHSELVAAGKATNLDQVKSDMQQRDLRDSTRAGARRTRPMRYSRAPRKWKRA